MGRWGGRVRTEVCDGVVACSVEGRLRGKQSWNEVDEHTRINARLVKMHECRFAVELLQE